MGDAETVGHPFDSTFMSFRETRVTWKGATMKSKAPFLAVFVVLLLGSQARAAGTTQILIVPAGGTGQITVSGSVELASNVSSFGGLMLFATDPMNNQTNGFVTLPKGNPVPGKGPVPYTGIIYLGAGTYKVTATMVYILPGNPQGQMQSALANGIVVK